MKDVERRDGFSRLQIEFPPAVVSGVAVGASVAINGACLTVRF